MPLKQHFIVYDSTKENLVTLDYTEATAQLQEDGSILCQPESISEKCIYVHVVHTGVQ